MTGRCRSNAPRTRRMPLLLPIMDSSSSIFGRESALIKNPEKLRSCLAMSACEALAPQLRLTFIQNGNRIQCKRATSMLWFLIQNDLNRRRLGIWISTRMSFHSPRTKECPNPYIAGRILSPLVHFGRDSEACAGASMRNGAWRHGFAGATAPGCRFDVFRAGRSLDIPGGMSAEASRPLLS